MRYRFSQYHEGGNLFECYVTFNELYDHAQPSVGHKGAPVMHNELG